MKDEFRSGARPVGMWKHNKPEALAVFCRPDQTEAFWKGNNSTGHVSHCSSSPRCKLVCMLDKHKHLYEWIIVLLIQYHANKTPQVRLLNYCQTDVTFEQVAHLSLYWQRSPPSSWSTGPAALPTAMSRTATQQNAIPKNSGQEKQHSQPLPGLPLRYQEPNSAECALWRFHRLLCSDESIKMKVSLAVARQLGVFLPAAP